MITPSFITKETSWFRNVGTSPLECWYVAGTLSQPIGSVSGVAPTIGVLKAVPFISGRGGSLDRIAFEVTTVGGASAKARVGIYSATSTSNLYPNALVVDGGEFDTSSVGGVGVKSTTISKFLAKNTLYWFVYLAGTSAATVRGLGVGTVWNLLGTDSTLPTTFNSVLSVSQAYGALPSTFPGSATPAAETAPIIAVRFSS